MWINSNNLLHVLWSWITSEEHERNLCGMTFSCCMKTEGSDTRHSLQRNIGAHERPRPQEQVQNEVLLRKFHRLFHWVTNYRTNAESYRKPRRFCCVWHKQAIEIVPGKYGWNILVWPWKGISVFWKFVGRAGFQGWIFCTVRVSDETTRLNEDCKLRVNPNLCLLSLYPPWPARYCQSLDYSQ